MSQPFQVVFDAGDPDRLARFWAEALGYVVQPPPEGYDSWEALLTEMGVPEAEWNSASAIVAPGGESPRIFFQRVPEGKTAKNRVHLDINAGGGHDVAIEERRERVDTTVRRLEAAGASVMGPKEERGEYWVVMQDPEGNEFCVQ